MNVNVQIQLGPHEYASDLPGNSTDLAEAIFEAVGGDPEKDTIYVTINDSGMAGNVPLPPPIVDPPTEPTMATVNSTFTTQNAPPPGDKQTRTNAAAAASATAVYVDAETTEGDDVSAQLLALEIGDTIEIRGSGDASRSAMFAVTAAPIDQSSFVELPVSFVEEGGALVNGRCTLTFPAK